MTPSPFLINDRYLVDAETNTVEDRQLGLPTRVEPRHMKLLCMLAQHEGKLVERSKVITELWNDYGGADDALTQAISFLRRTLGDGTKRLIVTIPKSGYILHATITSPQAVSASVERRLNKWKIYVVAAIGLALVATVWYLSTRTHAAPPGAMDVNGPREEAAAPVAP